MSMTWIDQTEVDRPDLVAEWLRLWHEHKEVGCSAGENCSVHRAAVMAGDDERFGVWLVLSFLSLHDEDTVIDTGLVDGFLWREAYNDGIDPDTAAHLAFLTDAIDMVAVINLDARKN